MKRSFWAGIARAVRIERPGRIGRDIDDELRFHMESRVAELIAGGQSSSDAWSQAGREFGDLDASRRELAEVDRRVRTRDRRASMRDLFTQDFSYAIRGLRRSPGLTAAIVITLSLAVGANAAVFSIIDPLFFRDPSGLRDPESLRRIYTVNPDTRSPTGSRAWRIFSYAQFRAIQDAVSEMARVAVFASRDSVPLSGGLDSTAVAVSYVTAEFLPMLARARHGRFFTADEDDVHAPAFVAVVSDAFRRRHFGETVDPVNQSINLDGHSYTIIGVASAGFEGIELSAVDLWVPFSTYPRLALDQQPWYEKGGVFLPMVMRLRPGVAEETVEARASLAYARGYASSDSLAARRSVIAGPLLEARSPIDPSKEVMIATRLAIVAAIVLMIASANVANLLLVRAIRRRRETALRLALGISRRRLASQALIEALVLVALTTVSALVVGRWMGAGLRLLLLPRVQWNDSGFDVRTAGFVAALTLLAALIAAIIPATTAGRLQLTADLAAGGHTVTSHRSFVRATLLVTQTSLSMMLLVGTALFVRSLTAVARVDMGFDTSHLIVASAFFDDGQRHPERGTAFPEVVDRLAGMRDIAGVAYGSTAPLYSWYSFVPLYESQHASELTTPTNRAEFIAVSSAYFEVVGTRIRQGRGFDRGDDRGSPRVMVIGESMARALWPTESPIGKCVHVRSKDTACYVVIGIAADVRGFRRLEEAAMRFYIPFSQALSDRTLPSVILVRTRSPSTAAIANTVKAELARALPGAGITSRTAQDVLAPELRPWRLGAVLFGTLGTLALLVAGIGVYSIVAFVVRQRSRELGVRVALGAPTGALIRMVVWQGSSVVALGVLTGTIGSLATGRFVSSLVYGISPRDLPSMLSAAATLLAVGILACLGPAIRSARTDPVTVLRAD